MTDLTAVLPGFPTLQYARILLSLEKHLVTTAELLTQDSGEIAKRVSLPVLDVKRLRNAALDALQTNLGVKEDGDGLRRRSWLKTPGEDLVHSWTTISTLDDDLDQALAGGIPTGHITEITGESGAGKTLFLLTLLLAAQLPAPRGLSSSVLYISTESALPTTRLSQLLQSHPVLLAADAKPTLDRIISIVTPDLESQDHILHFQVPVAVRRHGIRLIILDSVAANYRAEFDRPGAGAGAGQSSGANMGQRSSELVKLGQLLRDLAVEQNIAIVVANQVADRFSGGSGGSSPVLKRSAQSSPLARRSVLEGSMPDSSIPVLSVPPGSDVEELLFKSTVDPMSLDHQQRWFTGWGDDPHPSYLAARNLKTPSLGLVWTTQISCRIALIKRPVYGPGLVADEENDRGEAVLRKWRRWMKVVFAAHAPSSGPGVQDAVEFQIQAGGMTAIKKRGADDEDKGDEP